HAHLRASADQVERVGRGGDPNRARHRKQRKRRYRAPCAVTVEPHADRDLRGEQREEEGASRPAELAGAEPEVAREFGCDHAVGHAIELAEAGDCDQQQQERQLRCHGEGWLAWAIGCCPSAWAGASPWATIRNPRPPTPPA